MLILTTAIHAETVEVYQAVETPIPKKKKTQDRDGPGVWISLGKCIGAIDTGEKSLRSVVAGYKEQSWKAEPFYGPVEKFIFKDSASKLYIVHFEYLEGDKIFGKGVRFAIIDLAAIAEKKGYFVGSPYSGSSVTDERVLKQLREFASKKIKKVEQ